MDYRNELNDLIKIVFHEGASDLHFSEGRKPIIRVSGLLLPLVNKEELNRDAIRGILSELVGKEIFEKFLDTRELDFSYSVESGDRFRGNAYFQQGKISIALRLIPKKIRDFKELNLPEALKMF